MGQVGAVPVPYDRLEPIAGPALIAGRTEAAEARAG